MFHSTIRIKPTNTKWNYLYDLTTSINNVDTNEYINGSIVNESNRLKYPVRTNNTAHNTYNIANVINNVFVVVIVVYFNVNNVVVDYCYYLNYLNYRNYNHYCYYLYDTNHAYNDVRHTCNNNDVNYYNLTYKVIDNNINNVIIDIIKSNNTNDNNYKVKSSIKNKGKDNSDNIINIKDRGNTNDNTKGNINYIKDIDNVNYIKGKNTDSNNYNVKSKANNKMFF